MAGSNKTIWRRYRAGTKLHNNEYILWFVLELVYACTIVSLKLRSVEKIHNNILGIVIDMRDYYCRWAVRKIGILECPMDFPKYFLVTLVHRAYNHSFCIYFCIQYTSFTSLALNAFAVKHIDSLFYYYVPCIIIIQVHDKIFQPVVSHIFQNSIETR